LFEKGIKKIELQLTERSERSLSRKYHNEGVFHTDPVRANLPEEKQGGVKKIKLESHKDKTSSKRHIQPITLTSS
jgi:hypothetical protein